MLVRSLMVLALAASMGFAADDKKDDKKTEDFPKLIVGNWEITKAGGDVGAGSTLEFTKDNKVVLVVKKGDEKNTLKGSYKLDKDKLTVTLKVEDNSFDQVLTVTKLTEEAMELKDDKGGIDVLKKLK